MPDITWTHPALPEIVKSIPLEARTILDVGCGRGMIGAMCRIYREPTRIVGMDAFKPYLEFTRKLGLYDEVLEFNLYNTPLPFKDKEFDLVVCVEVIEHLPTDVGEKVIKELERVAKFVLITTPNEFFDQHEFDNNDMQRHLSLWSDKEFARRGYTVKGIGGLKFFGRSFRKISAAFGPLTRFVPGLSSLILCTKDTR